MRKTIMGYILYFLCSFAYNKCAITGNYIVKIIYLYIYVAEILQDKYYGIAIVILHEKPIYYDKITKCS